MEGGRKRLSAPVSRYAGSFVFRCRDPWNSIFMLAYSNNAYVNWKDIFPPMQRRILEKIRQPNGSFLLAIFTSLSNDRVNVSLWDLTESCEIF